MTEAKHLPPESSRPEPALFEATADEQAATKGAPTLLDMPLHRPGVKLTSYLLVLFLIFVVTFAVGAAIAFALVTGALDSQTGFLKDLMHQLKELVHSSPSP